MYLLLGSLTQLGVLFVTTLCVIVTSVYAEAIAESLQDAPRWDSVDFEDRSEARAGDTMVLAYKAIGQRGKERPYVALCSSTYARQAGAWKLLAHQQTPL